jgi:hypothetical protein
MAPSSGASPRTPQNLQSPAPSKHGDSSNVTLSAILDLESPGVLTEETDVEAPVISPALLRDLELMHHYTAYTSLTIADFATLNHIWQNVIPTEALSHTFLMYGILALAALHIAHDRPQVKDLYTPVALQYYNVAIASFRSALKKVNADNCTALFGFSTILIVLSFAFAQSPSPTQNQSPVDELIQIFTLLQGVRVVLQSATPWVSKGPLSPLLRRNAVQSSDTTRSSSHLPKDFDEALVRLGGYNERTYETADSHEMYKQTIQSLRDCVEKIEANPGDRAAAISWLFFLESSYVSSLKDNQPLALVILAHYGIVLNGLRDSWFVQELGTRVIEVVHLSLSEKWRPLVHWPMEQAGLRGELRDEKKTIALG